jgi:hypothetical protein
MTCFLCITFAGECYPHVGNLRTTAAASLCLALGRMQHVPSVEVHYRLFLFLHRERAESSKKTVNITRRTAQCHLTARRFPLMFLRSRRRPTSPPLSPKPTPATAASEGPDRSCPRLCRSGELGKHTSRLCGRLEALYRLVPTADLSTPTLAGRRALHHRLRVRHGRARRQA